MNVALVTGEHDFWRTMGQSSPTQRMVLIGFMLRAEHRPIVHGGPTPSRSFTYAFPVAEANRGQPKPGDIGLGAPGGLPKPLTSFRPGPAAWCETQGKAES